MSYDVAFVGTGADPENPTREGFGMAYRHAAGFENEDDCALVACADLVRENAAAFAAEHDIPETNVYEDYQTMLAEVEPDVVSICVRPAAHEELVVGTAESGVVEAIHSEKPMALTWGESRRMAAACRERDVQLTFNHQNRFSEQFRRVKALLDDGAIGDLQRVEYTWGNFYDTGSHAIDLCNYFNDEHGAEWVLAGLDYREEDVRFGTHNENQMIAQWVYENGVHGLAATGEGAGLHEWDWRLQGTAGVIETVIGKHKLRVKSDGASEWDVREYEQPEPKQERAIADVMAALRSGGESELSAANALTATEIIFGGWESVRRRGRVDFPLDIEDNPLEAMVESGALDPKTADEG